MPLFLNTQWTVTGEGSGATRFTWTGGTNPNLYAVTVGDIIGIFGLMFDEKNKGSFVITDIVTNTIGSTYVEFQNVFGVNEIQTQSNVNDVTFFRPIKNTILTRPRYATVFEIQPGVIQVFLPATTSIVSRGEIGAAHLHNTSVTIDGFKGPYIFDTTKLGAITEAATIIITTLEASQTHYVVNTANASAFPDQEGYVVFEFGTSKEEGPIKYVGRPASSLILLDPSYVFKKKHLPGASITRLLDRTPVALAGGSSYPMYITGTANARLYCADLIKSLVATGLTLNTTVLYPGDKGLGNAGFPDTGDKVSDRVTIWGGDVI